MRFFPWRARPAPPDPAAGPGYGFRPSLIGPPWQFDLTEEGLAFRKGMRRGVWPYADISRIRLSYRPTSMQARRYRADLRNGAGQKLSLVSVSWQTAALLSPQDHPYRRFITALHGRIAAAGGTPELIGGVSRAAHLASVIAVALVIAAMAGLFVRAALLGAVGGMVFLAGFAALFGWTVGRLLYRNRPRGYRLDAIPDDLLP